MWPARLSGTSASASLTGALQGPRRVSVGQNTFHCVNVRGHVCAHVGLWEWMCALGAVCISGFTVAQPLER